METLNVNVGDRPVRLVQLSDCHLPERPETDYRGVRADDGVAGLVPAVDAWRPDLLLLTGDLSEDGSPESYGRLNAILRPLERPMLAVPGNHDRPAEMRVRFPTGACAGSDEEPLAIAAGAWRIVLLDSTIRGRVEGRVRESDLDWLADWLTCNDTSPVLLALHHQPVPVGSPWIDRYMLRDPDPLLAMIEQHDNVRAVVWGHVHQSFEAAHGAARLLGCPSSAANSLPDTERFSPDPAGPAARWIELCPDGTLETGLLRATAAGAAARE